MINCGVLKRAVFHIAWSPFLPAPPADVCNFQLAYITYTDSPYTVCNIKVWHKCSPNSTCKNNEKCLQVQGSRKSPFLSYIPLFSFWNFWNGIIHLMLLLKCCW
jgi:hypothetical protein